MRSLVFSLDNKYFTPFFVLLFSLQKYNSIPNGTRIIIIHDNYFDLDSFSKEISKHSIFLNLDIEFINVTYKIPNNLPISSSDHISIATYYRLFISNIIPNEIESIIYLDSDMLSLKNISELFFMKINQPLAAVDHFSSADEVRLHGNFGGKYFQAGVLLIDLKYWRENNIEQEFLEILKLKKEKILWWDQDVLNIAFSNKWMPIDVGFNATQSKVLLKNNWYNDTIFDVKLIHFDGGLKPWNSELEMPFHNEWHAIHYELFGREFSKFRNIKIFIKKTIKNIYNLNLKKIVKILK